MVSRQFASGPGSFRRIKPRLDFLTRSGAEATLVEDRNGIAPIPPWILDGRSSCLREGTAWDERIYPQFPSGYISIYHQSSRDSREEWRRHAAYGGYQGMAVQESRHGWAVATGNEGRRDYLKLLSSCQSFPSLSFRQHRIRTSRKRYTTPTAGRKRDWARRDHGSQRNEPCASPYEG